MKRFSQLMQAGVPVEFEYPARSFTLLTCITPVDVSFGTGSQTQEIAKEMAPGFWYQAETPFRKIAITSPVNQEVSFLVSMGRSGWSPPPPSCTTVTMALAGQAALSLASTPVIDLGDDWASCVLGAQADLLVAGAGGSMSITCDDTNSMSLQRLACGIGYSNVAYVLVSGTNHHISSIRPTGRYVRGNFTNGANDQAGPARFMLHIMRNVTA